MRRLVALLAVIAVAFPAPVLAAPAPATTIDVTEVDTSRFPSVRVAFTRPDSDAPLPSIRINENGRRVSNVSTYAGKIGQFESDPRTVIMLAIDASDSMQGAKFTNAIQAARALIDQARDGDRIGLVTFGATSNVVVPPTSDTDAVAAALDRIELSRGTAMFDGVRTAAGAVPDDATRSVIVLLSDGADTSSSSDARAARAAAGSAHTEIYAVSLRDPHGDPDALRALANTSGGSFIEARSAADLTRIYSTLGRELLRGYWLEYQSGLASGQQIAIDIAAPGEPVTRTSFRAPAVQGSNGAIHLTPAPSSPAQDPLINLPHGPLGIALAALPFALLLGIFGYIFISRRGSTPLATRIAPYTRDQSEHGAAGPHERRGIRATFAPLLATTESFISGSGMFRRFTFMLEQANLPIREVELLYIMLGAGGAVMLCSLLAGAGLLLVLAAGTVAALLPYAWVRHKARSRKKAFELQLADVLSTVASSLRAGHSFNQSIAAVAKETPNPTAHELNRVMTEARLGLPLEEALEAMARRMGSQDFDFAVTTVNIQRTVGGSLSEILEMVADTVRGRQQFRKKVKALTSMGSMSAYVLLGMPFFMGGLLSLLSPDYMSPLWNTPQGQVMLIACGMFMLLGWVACRRIVAIKT